MKYYPIFLDLNGRRCAVIGGGPVAQRKVQGLLDAGAEVTVISPTLTDELMALASSGKIRYSPRRYAAGDLEGYDLAFVATNNAKVNTAVFQEGKHRRIWVNSADDPVHCDFILPGVIRRGELAIAVSTGGATPAMTRVVREELESYFTAEYADFVSVAAEARRELAEGCHSVSAEAWNTVLKGSYRRLVREGKLGQAKELLLSTLGASS